MGFSGFGIFSFWDVGCSCPNITVCAKDRGGACFNGEHCDDREKNVLRAVVFLVKYLKTACQPQGLAGCFVKKTATIFNSCWDPWRKSDDPPQQTMDPLPPLPDLKHLTYVKDRYL